LGDRCLPAPRPASTRHAARVPAVGQWCIDASLLRCCTDARGKACMNRAQLGLPVNRWQQKDETAYYVARLGYSDSARSVVE
jgi:hypothetical protein